MKNTDPVVCCRLLTLVLLFGCSLDIFAGAGVSDYSKTAQSLDQLVVWVSSIGAKVVAIIYAGAAVLCMYSIATIYIKIQTGDGGMMKGVYMLIGSAIFIVSSIKVIPAMFGLGHGQNTFWDSVFAPFW